MLTTLLTAALLTAPAEVTPKITSVSMFKNGYAMIMREVDVSGASEIVLAQIPVASLGSFWITATDGVRIQEVVNTTREVKSQTEVESLDDILRANVGRNLRIGIRDGDKVTGNEIVGKLVSAKGQIAVLENGKDSIAINKGLITSVSATGDGTLLYKTEATRTERVLRIKATSTGSGKIEMVGLERGLTWAPSYAIDISDEKQLSLTAKATVLNDLFDLKDAEARFITGFPNVPWATLQDPLLSGQSVDQFTAFLQNMGVPPGGFGGGRRDVMSQNAPAMKADFDAGWAPSDLPGVMAEDLFFYRQPNVTLKPGDRAYYFLFNTKADYEHLYTLDLGDPVVNNIEYQPVPEGPSDVWHSLKFKNTSKQPLTTGPATVFKDSQIMGQDTLSYTSIGSEVLLKMSKALDVRADQTEEEVSRERAAMRIPNSSVVYDLVTLKATIDIKNRKPEPVKMKITRDFTGELISAEGSPKSTKTAKGLRDVNPHSKLEWNPTVAAGKSLTLSFSYKVYVRGN